MSCINSDLKPIQLCTVARLTIYKIEWDQAWICVWKQCLSYGTCSRKAGEGHGQGVDGCLGRQVVGQLDERQGAVETLPLLLEAALGCSSPLVALLFLHDLFLLRLEFHGILLLLVLASHLALRLHLGGRWGALLTNLPITARSKGQNITCEERGKQQRSLNLCVCVSASTHFASHSATALLSTDWAFPWPSFGSSLFRREKGCLGQ